MIDCLRKVSISVALTLMREAISEVEKRHPGEPIEISAQSHLQKFYGSLGFEVISEEYLEDDIPHVDMLRRG